MDQEKIIEMYSFISKRYDLIGHLLSLNRDRYWRKFLVEKANHNSKTKILDVCTGTGEIPIEFALRGVKEKIIGVDLSRKMLEVAQKKLARRNLENRIELLKADARNLPFPNETFDLVTIAFGLRNIVELGRSIREMGRVLKRGGRILMLEFSLPQNAPLRGFYLLYLKIVGQVYGKVMVGSGVPYKYLATSISDFPEEKEILKLMEAKGLKNPSCQKLTKGIVTFYQGEK